MSLTLVPEAPAGAETLPTRGLMSLPGLVGLGMALSIIMTLPVIRQFMSTGFFLDPDDPMRLSQVRDFMNGQGWFDMTAWRLDPPHGVFMHWTRIVDVPMAALVWLFAWFTDQEMAERLMRLVLPLALLAGLFVASARIARLLVGEAGPLIAVLLTVFGGSMYAYFAPGRLDHDHVAVLGLVLMTGTLMRGLDPAQARAAALTGVIIAFNLSVSLETLPFIVFGVAALPAAWIFQGAAMQRNLRAFALGLGGGLLVAFAITVAPARYLNGACDTLSAAHMVAGLSGAGLCLALSFLTPRLKTVPLRLGAAVLAGLATIAAVALCYPACLADPYANVDPVMRALWLDGVSEARPLVKAVTLRPSLILILVVPILVGLAGALWAAVLEQGVMRARWIAISAIILAGCAASVWQVRATGVVLPLSLFGQAYIIFRLTRAALAKGNALAVPGVALAALVMSPMFLGMVAPNDTSAAEDTRSETEFSCRIEAAFTAIARLPPGNILAPIDTGGHLLARTPHGVMAAPFHRNEHGNRLALDVFRAEPGAAEAMVRASGTRYIAFCPGINDMEFYRDIAPRGLGAQLDAGNVPGWLKPLALDTPYKVFELVP